MPPQDDIYHSIFCWHQWCRKINTSSLSVTALVAMDIRAASPRPVVLGVEVGWSLPALLHCRRLQQRLPPCLLQRRAGVCLRGMPISWWLKGKSYIFVGLQTYLNKLYSTQQVAIFASNIPPWCLSNLLSVGDFAPTLLEHLYDQHHLEDHHLAKGPPQEMPMMSKYLTLEIPTKLATHDRHGILFPYFRIQPLLSSLNWNSQDLSQTYIHQIHPIQLFAHLFQVPLCTRGTLSSFCLSKLPDLPMPGATQHDRAGCWDGWVPQICNLAFVRFSWETCEKISAKFGWELNCEARYKLIDSEKVGS